VDGAPEVAAERVVIRRPIDALIAGVGFVVLLGSAWVALDGVPEWERDVFAAINGLPDALQPLMFGFQLLGVVVVPLGLAALVLVKGWRRTALALVLLVPLKLVVELRIIKMLVDRERPAASICRGDLECGRFRDVPLAGVSFPSGHAVIAAGIVVILWPVLTRQLRLVAVVLAVGVCVGRVYLGAHNPLDVVAGAAVGLVLGGLLNLMIGVPAEPRADEPPSLAPLPSSS
jgi:undecaprenyl-diphosphatase